MTDATTTTVRHAHAPEPGRGLKQRAYRNVERQREERHAGRHDEIVQARVEAECREQPGGDRGCRPAMTASRSTVMAAITQEPGGRDFAETLSDE